MTPERIAALCEDALYASVSGDQAEWDELRELALKGCAAPEAALIPMSMRAFTSPARLEAYCIAKSRQPGGSGYSWQVVYDMINTHESPPQESGKP